MAIDFPNSPSVNQTFTSGYNTWIWTGSVWKNVNPNIAWGGIVGTLSNQSDLQSALDLKANQSDVLPKTVTANRQTSSYTLALSDAAKIVEMNVGTANNLTIPLFVNVAFPTGTQILISQYGAGQTTIVPDSGVTLRSSGGKTKLMNQYSGATLLKIGTNEWYLFGDITT